MNVLDELKEGVKPDLTPMIDVVFLMIIFFICIDFRVLESKLPAYLPLDRAGGHAASQPQEQLSVKIHVAAEGVKNFPDGVAPGAVHAPSKRPYRFVLDGHSIRWEVGPKRFDTIDDVKNELRRIAQDPASLVPDRATGTRKLLACVLEAYPGTYYGDVALTADACHEAGFEQIHFGGGFGAGK